MDIGFFGGEMLSTNLILRIYLIRFIAIFGLSVFIHCHINVASITCDNSVQIIERTELNAEDAERIEQTFKIKLMMLNTRENHSHTTAFELVGVHSMTVRLTVGLMYESIVRLKLNESVHNCTIELWVMPLLNANKFQMKCDDDKQREYHLIDGGLRQMNVNELSEFGEKLASTLQQQPNLRENFDVALHQVVSAERVSVNGFIDLARVSLQNFTSNETMDCAVEAWGSALSFRELNIACESNVYRVISSIKTSKN